MKGLGQRSFTIGTCLGRGGFGEVYRATMSTPSGLRREVAIKLLRADLDVADEAVRRLRDEGRMLARLDHPALLVVYDLVDLDGRVALVTELVDGEDLEACFRAGMPLRCVLQAVGVAADALHAAWTAPLGPDGRPLRLAHRDIKPSNIRISRHGAVKVLDFGIARSDEMIREARTATDLLVGSPAYMAPERFLDAEVRSASDVWALGCCLYEGAAGVRLFGGVSAMILSTMALSRDRYEAFLRERPLPADVPDAFAALVRACLAYDPEDRPTAAALARRCEALADQIGGPTLRQWTREREWPADEGVPGPLVGQVVTVGAASSRPTSPAPRPASRRRGIGWLVAGGGVVAGSALFVGAAAGLGAVLWGIDWMSADAGETPVADAAPEAPPPAPSPAGAPEAPPRVVPSGGVGLDAEVAQGPDTGDPAPASEDTAEEVPLEPGSGALEAGGGAAGRGRASSRAAATGTVVLVGSFTDVALVRGDEVRPLSTDPTPVPAGAWTVRSMDPLVAPIVEWTLDVTPGAEIRLDCSRALGRCRIR